MNPYHALNVISVLTSAYNFGVSAVTETGWRGQVLFWLGVATSIITILANGQRFIREWRERKRVEKLGE